MTIGACVIGCPASSARTLISYKPSRMSAADAAVATSATAAMSDFIAILICSQQNKVVAAAATLNLKVSLCRNRVLVGTSFTAEQGCPDGSAPTRRYTRA